LGKLANQIALLFIVAVYFAFVAAALMLGYSASWKWNSFVCI